jgi:glycosyltransferase involved in cell wall biosynthesis
LTEYATLVTDIREQEYDYIISIDTPEILKYKISSNKLLFECHSTYVRDRVYLPRLPSKVRLIAVPSVAMKIDLEQERPELVGKIVLLRNYVADYPAQYEDSGVFWQKRPLLYLGRMDEHKNIREVLDIFECYRSNHGDDLMLVLVGMIAESIDLQAELRRRNLVDRTVVFPPVRFDRVRQIYSLVKAHKGIFISSSQDESFGLSVAEAMVNGLPVLLSGTRAHAGLVLDDMDFLYPLGDVPGGAIKLKSIVCSYDDLQKKVEEWKGRFSVETFIEDWHCFIKSLSV